MALLDILNQALAAAGAGRDPQLDQAAAAAPGDVLGRGLAAAFGSAQTPPIGDMVANLFERSDGGQQAGALNALIAAIGPAAATALAGGALGRVLQPGQTSVSAEQAQQLDPAQVRDLVAQADREHPGIADQLGRFYADHRGLLNTLGGVAASIALMKMKDHLAERG